MNGTTSTRYEVQLFDKNGNELLSHPARRISTPDQIAERADEILSMFNRNIRNSSRYAGGGSTQAASYSITENDWTVQA